MSVCDWRSCDNGGLRVFNIDEWFESVKEAIVNSIGVSTTGYRRGFENIVIA